MRNVDLCWLSASELAGGYSRREFSPVDVVDALLERIATLDDYLHCYISVTGELARDKARESEVRWKQGRPLSGLDGVPIGLKDLFDTAGIRTTANSLVYDDRVPVVDATATRKLAG